VFSRRNIYILAHRISQDDITMTKEIYKDRLVVGLYEKIKIIGKKGEATVIARIDTGATKSSVDKKLAERLDFGPVVGKKIVKSSHGNSIRPMVLVPIILKGMNIKEKFTIADRSQLKYPVLIGQNILKKGFLIDPMKK